MHLLNYDTIVYRFVWRCYITPNLFMFNYTMALLGVIFATYLWPYKRNSKVHWLTCSHVCIRQGIRAFPHVFVYFNLENWTLIPRHCAFLFLITGTGNTWVIHISLWLTRCFAAFIPNMTWRTDRLYWYETNPIKIASFNMRFIIRTIIHQRSTVGFKASSI